jgi:hypothetical protein
MTSVTNINEVLEGHVALEVECVDRLYLNAYVPQLQVGGQVVSFLTAHLGNPIPSVALMGRIGNRPPSARNLRSVTTSRVPITKNH